MCNTAGVRTFEVIFSLALISISAWVLWRLQKGRIKGIAFPRYFWITGKDAKTVSTILAVLFMFVGLFVLIAALLRLDC